MWRRPRDQTHLVHTEPVPDASTAVANLDQLDVVGLTEEFAATMCLVTHKLGRVPKPSCFCDGGEAARDVPPSATRNGAFPAHPHRHAAQPREKSRSVRMFSSLGVDALPHLHATIDALTAVDDRLYVRQQGL